MLERRVLAAGWGLLGLSLLTEVVNFDVGSILGDNGVEETNLVPGLGSLYVWMGFQ